MWSSYHTTRTMADGFLRSCRCFPTSYGSRGIILRLSLGVERSASEIVDRGRLGIGEVIILNH